MNKPAPKEPSMDEILSSIRQIIADDDASPMPPRPAAVPAPPMAPEPVRAAPAIEQEPGPAEPPLALSPEQILGEDDEGVPDFGRLAAEVQADHEIEQVAAVEAVEGVKAEFIDPDDIAFEAEPPAPATPVAPPAVAPVEPVRPRPTTAQAAPMPDPKLAADIADQLLEPTTNAAVRANFARLGSLAVGTPGLTVEGMMREMLRPMLKEWLDEHLPAVVERMVEKEIARISRGVE